MKSLNKNNYKDLKGISVIEVSGESCANCLSLMPILNKLISNRNDCELYHLEATIETAELINFFKVEAVPTILILKDLEVLAKCKGYQPEEILELWLDAKIEEIKSTKNV